MVEDLNKLVMVQKYLSILDRMKGKSFSWAMAKHIVGGEKRLKRLMEEEKVHGFWLPAAAVRAWLDRLWDLPPQARAFPVLEARRADIIAHGALILDRALCALERLGVRVSTADNLLGYLRLRGERGSHAEG